jgi:hypothetical protein
MSMTAGWDETEFEAIFREHYRRGSSSNIHRLTGGSPALSESAGQFKNRAKWKRSAALTWYSSAVDWARADRGIPDKSRTRQSSSNFRAEIHAGLE